MRRDGMDRYRNYRPVHLISGPDQQCEVDAACHQGTSEDPEFEKAGPGQAYGLVLNARLQEQALHEQAHHQARRDEQEAPAAARVEGMGVCVENQSAAIPATAGKPSDMLLNAPSKLQESSPTQTLEISKTVAFRPGRIMTG